MQKISLEALAFDTIRNQIIRGDHMPGTLLSENQLASELGMSRTPVRAAIALLEKEGLVESFKGRGVLIKEISFLQFCQIHEIFTSMQVFVLDVAKVRDLFFNLDALKLCIQQLDTAREAEDYLSYYETTIKCIEIIIQAIANDQMIQLLRQYEGIYICRMITFRKQFPQHKPQWTSVVNGKIYKALLGKDYDRAKEAVLENYRNANEQLSLRGLI